MSPRLTLVSPGDLLWDFRGSSALTPHLESHKDAAIPPGPPETQTDRDEVTASEVSALTRPRHSHEGASWKRHREEPHLSRGRGSPGVQGGWGGGGEGRRWRRSCQAPDGRAGAQGWPWEGRVGEPQGPFAVLESLTLNADAAKHPRSRLGGRGALGWVAPRAGVGVVRLSRAIRPPASSPVGPHLPSELQPALLTRRRLLCLDPFLLPPPALPTGSFPAFTSQD